MDSTTIFIIVFAAIAVFAVIYILTSKNGRNDKPHSQVHEGAKMQLQAYERLIVLADRIALPNLIARVSQPGLSARDMQMLLTHAIKEEFNHNITQQIYVTADAWTAVKNLKEQNMLIINQLANVLPPDAKSNDLNKILLEYLMNNKKGALHEVVSEVLSYEAKKLLETE